MFLGPGNLLTNLTCCMIQVNKHIHDTLPIRAPKLEFNNQNPTSTQIYPPHSKKSTQEEIKRKKGVQKEETKGKSTKILCSFS